MFRFTIQGRIGRIDQVKAPDAVVRISIAADRIVEGQDGAWTKTEWLNCVSFDRALNQRMLTELEVGQSVTLDGRIEPRKREVEGRKITDHSFVVTRFDRMSKPKANGKAKSAPHQEEAAA